MDIHLKAQNLKELDQWLPSDEKNQAKCEVFLDLSMKNFEINKLKKIDKLFEQYKNLKRIVLIFHPNEYTIPRQQLSEAFDFQVDKKIDIAFEDSAFGYYGIGEVDLAMSKVYEHVDFIEQNKFSPLEALLYSYFVATNKPYKLESKEEDLGASRSLYPIMTNDKMVCLGYCNLIKGIINNTNIGKDKIQLFDNSTTSYEKNKTELHATLVAYVKDDKYNINGYYYLDPTSDAELRLYKRSKNRSFFFSSFMIPLSDMEYSTRELKEMKFNHFYDYDSGDEPADQNFKKVLYDSSLKFSEEGLVINKDFEKALKNNDKIMSDLVKNYNLDLNKTTFEKLYKNPKLLEGALLENSEPVPLGCLINACYKVLDTMKIYPTKQQNFYFTKMIINENILGNEFDFKKGAKNEISICEEGYKI